MTKKNKASRRVRQNGYHALDSDDNNSSSASSTIRPSSRNNKYGNNNNKQSRKSKRNDKGSSSSSREDLLLRASITEDGTKEIIEIDADGNCLFRAISDQLYYDHGAAHVDIRADICHYLEAHESDFLGFLVLDDDDARDEEDASDFTSYVEKMRQDGEWGGNVELVAACRLYQRNIVVYSAELDAYRIECEAARGPDMMVSYHDNDHYNSVRDCRMSKPPTFTKVYYEQPPVEDDDENDETEKENEGDESTQASSQSHSSPEEDEAANVDEAAVNETAAASPPTPLSKSAPCPCGSGRRYKKCCHVKVEAAQAVNRKAPINRLASEEEEEVELGGRMRVMVL